ncbi:MAG: hypothetical protein KAJ40_03500 [Alphaproteobacteria bacterium]|nr:hypothetical protein [Alphaproteobacteria bacterium]
MTTEKPSDQNMSFAMLADNPRRDLVEKILISALVDMEQTEKVPKPVLSEILFDLAMFEMWPNSSSAKDAEIVRLCQLRRFRKTIDDQLEAISDVYKKESK